MFESNTFLNLLLCSISSVMDCSKPRTVLNHQCRKSCTTPGLHTEFLCATWSFTTSVDCQVQLYNCTWRSTEVVKLQVVQRNSVCNPGVVPFHLSKSKTTLLLLLFASTKFCDFGIATILRVLIFAISWSGAKFCDFVQPNVKAQLWNSLAYWQCLD